MKKALQLLSGGMMVALFMVTATAVSGQASPEEF